MAPLRIRTKVEGETITLPELKSMIGKTVDIEITERPDEDAVAKRWAEAADAAKELVHYDFDAWAEQRAFDAHRLGDHLR